MQTPRRYYIHERRKDLHKYIKTSESNYRVNDGLGDPDRKTAPPRGGKGGGGKGNWKRGGPKALHNEKVNVIDHTPFEENPALKDKEISDSDEEE